MTISKEQNEALKIQAMLQGLTVEDLSKQMFDDEEIIIEDEAPKKKKGGSRKKKEVEHKVEVNNNVEELDVFKPLHIVKHVDIIFNSHSMEESNQTWPIPLRTVEYSTEIVKNRKRAKDMAEMFTPNSEQEKESAYNGSVRYLKLTTYTESINFRVREAGYAKVWDNNGKLKYKVIMNKELKNNNVNIDSVRRDFEEALKELTV